MNMSQNILGTNVIVQIGIIVKDIEGTAKAYAEIFGMEPPPIHITDTWEATHMQFHGEPSRGRAKLAFFKMGALQLELIEPLGEGSTWKEFLEQKGEGLHHFAVQIKDTDAVVKKLAEKGIPVVQQGDYVGGRYAYMASEPVLGTVIELLENYSS
jgi:methylmalonyl-CoA/ethylmalonyl-CoA epimerase